MTGRRLRCLVPFCKRTRGDRKNDLLPANLDGYEWICALHWRLVDKRTKRLYRLAKWRGKPPHVRFWIWDRLRKQAIERGAGVN